MALSDFATLVSSTFAGEKGNEYVMLTNASLMEIRASLMYLEKVHGNKILVDQEALVANLYLLQTETNTWPQKNDEQIETAFIELRAQLAISIEQKYTIAQSSKLINALDKVHDALLSALKQKRSKQNTFKRTTLALSLLPFMGLGLHYFNGHYFQAMYFDETHMIFPQDVYTHSPSQLSIEVPAREAIYKQYGRYYYNEYITNGLDEMLGMGNIKYLPTL